MPRHYHHDQPPKSRVQFDLTPQQLARYFHLPQREAARQLHMAEITLKRICKRAHVRWPYRAQKAAIARARRQCSTGSGCVAMTTRKDAETEEDDKNHDQVQSRTIGAVKNRLADKGHVCRAIYSLTWFARQPVTEPASASTLAPAPRSAAAILFARLPELCMSEHLAW